MNVFTETNCPRRKIIQTSYIFLLSEKIPLFSSIITERERKGRVTSEFSHPKVLLFATRITATPAADAAPATTSIAIGLEARASESVARQ